MQLNWNIRAEEQLHAIAQTVEKYCSERCFLALHGDLGVGKTAFIRALGALWGISDVRSPSFDLLHVQKGTRTLVHIDAYRLPKNNAFSFDLDDLCHPPFCVAVEWPERLAERFAFSAHLWFSLQPNGSREIRFQTEA